MIPNTNAHKIPKAQLIAIAESFAGVSPFADACYRYYFYHDKACHDRLSSCLAVEFSEHLKDIPPKYHAPIIATALTEMTYPQKTPFRPAFCAKERASCMGISRRQYYRLNADFAINNIINNLTGIAYVVAGKVREQLGKRKFQLGY